MSRADTSPYAKIRWGLMLHRSVAEHEAAHAVAAVAVGARLKAVAIWKGVLRVCDEPSPGICDVDAEHLPASERAIIGMAGEAWEGMFSLNHAYEHDGHCGSDRDYAADLVGQAGIAVARRSATLILVSRRGLVRRIARELQTREYLSADDVERILVAANWLTGGGQ